MNVRAAIAGVLLGAAGLGGCVKEECLGGCGGGPGDPKIAVASSSDGVSTAFANECELDVDFADAGPGAEVVVRVDDVGSGVLDLSRFSFASAALVRAFPLQVPTLATIRPGQSYEFGIRFEPPDAGVFDETFTIETDGINYACPQPSSLTVSLVATWP